MNPFKKEHKQKSIFITAGYPRIDSLPEQLKLIENNNIDFVEIGIPFSDPIADGPTIQMTSNIAIENGMNIALLFNQLQTIRTKLPLVLMGYLNPILNYGIDNFISQCKTCGVSAVIIPDLSVDIYERDYEEFFQKHDFSICFLITPSTKLERVVKMAKHCQKSFLYLVSGHATTGSQNELDLDLARIKIIKAYVKEIPLMIGFGIKNKHDVARVHEVSEGAIVGTAFLKVVESGKEEEFLKAL